MTARGDGNRPGHLAFDVDAEASVHELPLPTYRHLPGTNERPPHGFLDAVIARAPAETRAPEAGTNVAWLYGVRLINAGFFWEAHEVLEPVWAHAAPNSRERFLVQAVIHLANGSLKVRMARPNAAARLADLADESFERAFAGSNERFMGIDPREALAAGHAIRDGAESLTLSLE